MLKSTDWRLTGAQLSTVAGEPGHAVKTGPFFGTRRDPPKNRETTRKAEPSTSGGQIEMDRNANWGPILCIAFSGGSKKKNPCMEISAQLTNLKSTAERSKAKLREGNPKAPSRDFTEDFGVKVPLRRRKKKGQVGSPPKDTGGWKETPHQVLGGGLTSTKAPAKVSNGKRGGKTKSERPWPKRRWMGGALNLPLLSYGGQPVGIITNKVRSHQGW